MSAGEFTSDSGYAAARALRGTRLELAGATYNNRDWIKSERGTYDKDKKIWSLPMPSNNATAAQLLHDITSRGMQWRAR